MVTAVDFIDVLSAIMFSFVTIVIKNIDNKIKPFDNISNILTKVNSNIQIF